jgi:hypothetical protein
MLSGNYPEISIVYHISCGLCPFGQDVPSNIEYARIIKTSAIRDSRNRDRALEWWGSHFDPHIWD